MPWTAGKIQSILENDPSSLTELISCRPEGARNRLLGSDNMPPHNARRNPYL